MEDQIILRKTTFGGFEKTSVLNYISEMGNAAKIAEDSLNHQLEEVALSREKLGQTVKDLEEKMTRLQDSKDNVVFEFEGEKKRTGELNLLLERLGEDIKRQEQIIDNKEQEIIAYGEKYSALEQRSQLLESKQQEIERASSHIGELMLKTQAESDKIIEQAGKEAQELILQATKSMDGVYEEFRTFSREVDAVQNQLKLVMESIQDKFSGLGKTIHQVEGNLNFSYKVPTNPIKLFGDTLKEDCIYSDLDDDDDDDMSNFFRAAAEN